ncbi:MAG TPA: hypothetical protein VNW97_14450 [Candidatus Saccharimonadales bacterium]|nr:hypothetical protein [Candidatus Saccharimonadales bacterium]
MTYEAFKDWFFVKKAALAIPGDCSPQEPVFFRTPRNWTLNWVLLFDDSAYIRIHEHYSAPHARAGRRIQFAMHYGPIVKRGETGAIEYDRGDPVIIRIDTFPEPVHLHLRSDQPHLSQETIEGLDLVSIGVFDFVARIFDHRQSARSIEDLFGFRIT